MILVLVVYHITNMMMKSGIYERFCHTTLILAIFGACQCPTLKPDFLLMSDREAFNMLV